MTDDRFWSKVKRTRGCWLWTASVTSQGYGRFVRPDGVETTAHRYAWTLTHGEPPQGIEVDHLCRRRNCVRVEHLSLKTKAENLADRVHRNTKKTHCIRGHELSGDNLWHPPSASHKRQCRQCNADRGKARRATRLP